jgi:hypothetical protein
MIATLITVGIAANVGVLATQGMRAGNALVKSVTGNDRTKRTYNNPNVVYRTPYKVKSIVGKYLPPNTTLETATETQLATQPYTTFYTRMKDLDPKDNWPLPSLTRAWKDHHGIVIQFPRDQLPPLDGVIKIHLLGDSFVLRT